MRISDIFEAISVYGRRGSTPCDARSFGIWLGRRHSDLCPDLYGKEGIYSYDYLDDGRDRALRYRLMVNLHFLKFVHSMKDEIAEKGWHLTVETKRARNRWQLVFEPIETAMVPRSGVFWHLTPTANVADVLRDGLQPRQSRFGFSYAQPRVYLIREQKHARLMADSLARRDGGKVAYSLLRVDLRQAKGIRLHTDPELREVAVYTTEPIPARFMQLAQERVVEGSNEEDDPLGRLAQRWGEILDKADQLRAQQVQKPRKQRPPALPKPPVRSGPFPEFLKQVYREAETYLGIEDAEDEIDASDVREWMTTHRGLFHRKRVTVYRVMQLPEYFITALAPEGSIGQHWSFNFNPDNIVFFNISRKAPQPLYLFECEIDAADIHLPLTVAYNCLFPHEEEVFIGRVGQPVFKAVYKLNSNLDREGDNLRPDLVGAKMKP